MRSNPGFLLKSFLLYLKLYWKFSNKVVFKNFIFISASRRWFRGFGTTRRSVPFFRSTIYRNLQRSSDNFASWYCRQWEIYSCQANEGTGTPPLTRFFGPEKNRVKGKPRFRRSILVLKPKLYIPSTLNIDLILWHTQLIVCAENVKSWFKSWVFPFTFQAYILPHTLNWMCVSLFKFHIWILEQF